MVNEYNKEVKVMNACENEDNYNRCDVYFKVTIGAYSFRILKLTISPIKTQKDQDEIQFLETYHTKG